MPPILLSNLLQGKEKYWGKQAAYDSESLGGNTDLESIIPKPQQPPLYHFLVQLKDSLRKFCSLSEIQMCDFDVPSVLSAT